VYSHCSRDAKSNFWVICDIPFKGPIWVDLFEEEI
jgi:hypothetical protein